MGHWRLLVRIFYGSLALRVNNTVKALTKVTASIQKITKIAYDILDIELSGVNTVRS